MARWFLRGAEAVVGLLFASVLLQWTWEAVDRARWPAAGQFVRAPGGQIHLLCAGARPPGSPVVLLEGGLGATTAMWARIQPLVAARARVCSYDRAGMGWSTPRAGPRDAVHIARDLHELLQAAAVLPPYVLVGHSFGGLYVRAFAEAFPAEVAGMVLLESSHPDQFQRGDSQPGNSQVGDSRAGDSRAGNSRAGNVRASDVRAGGNARAQYTQLRRMYAVLPWAARLGVLRFNSFCAAPAHFPAPAAAALHSTCAAAAGWTTQQAELDALDATMAQVRAARLPPALPLVVVSGAQHVAASADWGVLQHELGLLSRQSMFRVVAGGTHTSIWQEPAQAAACASAILSVVAAPT